MKHDFEAKKTIVIHYRMYPKTKLGTRQLACQYDYTVKGVNLCCTVGNEIWILTQGTELDMSRSTKYQDTDVNPDVTIPIGKTIKIGTYNNGFVETNGNYAAVRVRFDSWDYLIANNIPLYDREKVVELAKDKKVLANTTDGLTMTIFALPLTDMFTGMGKVYPTSTQQLVGIIEMETGADLYVNKVKTTYPEIKGDGVRIIENDYPLGILTPNITSYVCNMQSLMLINVNDVDKYMAPTYFDAYQNNNVTSVYWNNTEEFLQNGMVIDFRVARGYLSEKVEEFSQNWKTTGYSFDPVNITWDILKNVMGLGALFTKELYVYIRARNIAQDYETSWAYLAINADGYVSAHGYVGNQNRITLTVHKVGEEPPEGVTKDDEKGDNDEQKTSGETPKGHDPSNDSEMGLNVLTTSYILTTAQLKTLGNELWSDDFMKNIKMLNNSPIENVLSCKIFPTSFTGAAALVKIGNVSMLNGTTALKLSSTSIKKETGTINIVKKFNSFLDFEPFTTAKIFLPFIGFQPITLADFYGATLGVRYVFDIVTGSCTAFILRNGNVHDKYSGQCAVDVPITASNRAQVEVGQIQSALTGLASAATGNITGALTAGLAVASTPNHFNTRGNGGGATSVYDPRQPFLVIDRPNAQTEISAYAATIGRVCNLTKTLNTLSGFTSVHDVHLDDVPCLESERQELKSIMQKGFVI